LNAEQVHKESIIVDGLFFKIDTPIPPDENGVGSDLMLEHIEGSGITAFNHSVIFDATPQTMSDALQSLYRDTTMFQAFPDRMMQIRSVDDLKTAKKQGKVGVIFGTQGLACLGTTMSNVWVLHSLGVRIMQLTYNERNALGSGCMEPNDLGLTRFGQQAIEEMNRVGAALDLSHCGERTSLDAIAHSKHPTLITHVGVQALWKHPRNVTDDQIRAIADSGGVVGICPHSIMVEKARGQRPSVNDYIDHMEHVANLVGIDHVGIGTDNFQYDTFYSRVGRTQFEQTFPGFFGGYGPYEKHAAGFSKWSDWPNLTRSLLERGFSVEDTKKILGGNYIRVFEQVWK
jgi:membrane dipeptidase